jgi:hypothetical protein
MIPDLFPSRQDRPNKGNTKRTSKRPKLSFNPQGISIITTITKPGPNHYHYVVNYHPGDDLYHQLRLLEPNYLGCFATPPQRLVGSFYGHLHHGNCLRGRIL